MRHPVCCLLSISFGFFTDALSDPEIHRTAVLLLGHMAGKLYRSDEHEAKGDHILYKIEDGLGIHGMY